MKNLISLLMVMITCISICACGNDSKKYVGVWESAHMRFTINEGGIGRYERLESDTGYYDFTWEIKDEILIITIDSIRKSVSSFELNDDGSSLTILQNGLPTSQPGETIYSKIG